MDKSIACIFWATQNYRFNDYLSISVKLSIIFYLLPVDFIPMNS